MITTTLEYIEDTLQSSLKARCADSNTCGLISNKFRHTTNSYKIFWFASLLEIIQVNKEASIQEILEKMVILAW